MLAVPSLSASHSSLGAAWHWGLNGDTTPSQAKLQWEVLRFPLPVKQALGSIVPWQVIHGCQDLPGCVLLRVSSWEYLPWLCRNRALKREFLCQVDKWSQMLWTGKPQNHTETVHKEPSLRYFLWTQRYHCQERAQSNSSTDPNLRAFPCTYIDTKRWQLQCSQICFHLQLVGEEEELKQVYIYIKYLSKMLWFVDIFGRIDLFSHWRKA